MLVHVECVWALRFYDSVRYRLPARICFMAMDDKKMLCDSFASQQMYATLFFSRQPSIFQKCENVEQYSLDFYGSIVNLNLFRC